jgi:hypothetical protein
MLLSLAELVRLKGPQPMGLFKDGNVKCSVQREKRLVLGCERYQSIDLA